MDRDSDKKPEMIEKFEEIFKVFDRLDNPKDSPHLKKYKKGVNCDTSFKYKLDDAGIETMNLGIDNFKKTVSFVLAFNP